MANCVHCEDVITNPLCNGCINDAVGQWLITKKLRNKRNNRLLEVHDLNNKSNELLLQDLAEDKIGETCILCGKELQLCTYCYTKDIFELIEESSPELLDEFVEFFSFDLDKKGYAKYFFEMN